MKQSLKTRMLSLLLVLVMLFGMFPAVIAAEEEPIEEQEITEEVFLEETEENAPAEEEAPAAEEPAEEAPAAEEEASPAGEELVPEEAAPAEEPEGTPVTFIMGSAFSIAVNGGAYQAAEAAEEGYVLVLNLQAGSCEVSLRAEGYKDGTLTVTVEEEPQTVALVPETYENGIQGMDDSYELTEQDLNGIAFMEENAYLSLLETMEPDKDYEADQLMFLAESEEEALAAAAAYGAVLSHFQDGVAVLELSEDLTVEEALRACSDPGNRLPFVEPVTKVSLNPVEGRSENREAVSSAKAVTSNYNYVLLANMANAFGIQMDEYLANPSGYPYQYQHDVMNTYEAWGIVPGDYSAKVAIIDSGINGSHEDLKNNLAASYYYYDSKYGIYSANDENGHGTHCAGIVGAGVFNDAGGAGINPWAKLYCYRALNADGTGRNSGIVAGINWAVNQGVDVISLSLGDYFPSYAEEQAIRNAVSQGIVVVAAAGNDGSNVKMYPAAYNIPGMISVGALDRNKTRAYYSNYGSWVDVYAPGSYIVSAYKGSTSSYEVDSGTSMATPAVAGAASLYITCLRYAGKTVYPKTVESAVKGSVTSGSVDCMKLVSKGFTAAGIKVKAMAGVKDRSEKYPNGSTVPSNVKLKLEAESLSEGETIYYTLDGSEPMFFRGKAVNGIAYDGTGISLEDYAVGRKITVTAVACADNGEKGTVTKVTYQIGEAADFSAISITAPVALEAGEKADILAKDYFGTDISGEVTWAVTLADGTLSDKVTITKAGVVCAEVEEDCAILVTAISGEGRTGSKLIQVNAADGTAAAQNVSTLKVTRVDINAKYSIGVDEGVACSFNKNGTLKSVTLYTYNVDDSAGIDETRATVKAGLWYTGTLNSNVVEWSSNKESIAYLDISSNVVVCAGEKTGNATITAKAMDGSGKKATFKVIVKAPASYVDIKTSAVPDGYYGDYYLAPGKSATHKAIVGDTFGKPTGYKVYWEAYLYKYSASSGTMVSSWASYSNPEYVKISSSGRLTLGSRVKELSGFYSSAYYWRVYVDCYVISDGHFTVSNSICYDVAPQVTKIVPQLSTLYMYKSSEDGIYIMMYADGFTDCDPLSVYLGAYSVTSSNPSVCSAFYDGNEDAVMLKTSEKAGTATITVKALDGSGKKCSFKVKVS